MDLKSLMCTVLFCQQFQMPEALASRNMLPCWYCWYPWGVSCDVSRIFESAEYSTTLLLQHWSDRLGKLAMAAHSALSIQEPRDC